MVKCNEVQEFASLLCRGNPTAVDVALHYIDTWHSLVPLPVDLGVASRHASTAFVALFESPEWKDFIHFILTHSLRASLGPSEHLRVHRTPFLSACFLRQSIGENEDRQRGGQRFLCEYFADNGGIQDKRTKSSSALDSMSFSSTLRLIDLIWFDLIWFDLSWVELSWVELSWVELSSRLSISPCFKL